MVGVLANRLPGVALRLRPANRYDSSGVARSQLMDMTPFLFESPRRSSGQKVRPGQVLAPRSGSFELRAVLLDQGRVVGGLVDWRLGEDRIVSRSIGKLVREQGV